MEIGSWKRLAIFLIVAAALGLLPIIFEMGPARMNTLIMLFIYIVLAESWNLLGGFTGLFNLGLAAFFGIGALVTHLVWDAGAPLVFAILAGGLTGIVTATIIGIPTLRLKGFYFSVATLALAEALRLTIGNLFPRTIRLGSEYFIDFSYVPRFYLAFGLMLLVLVTMYLIINSKFGIALLAIRDNEEAAAVTGVNVYRCKVIVFVISTFFIGLAGGTYTYYRLTFAPVAQFTTNWTFDPLIAACIGGTGTILGPILGSILLVIVHNWFALALAGTHLIVLGVIFILVITFYPGGLNQLFLKTYVCFINMYLRLQKLRNIQK